MGLIGFVFSVSAKPFIFIILCVILAYVHLAFKQIGFVLHNLLIAYGVQRTAWRIEKTAYSIFHGSLVIGHSRIRELGLLAGIVPPILLVF